MIFPHFEWKQSRKLDEQKFKCICTYVRASSAHTVCIYVSMTMCLCACHVGSDFLSPGSIVGNENCNAE